MFKNTEQMLTALYVSSTSLTRNFSSSSEFKDDDSLLLWDLESNEENNTEDPLRLVADNAEAEESIRDWSDRPIHLEADNSEAEESIRDWSDRPIHLEADNAEAEESMRTWAPRR